MSPARPTAGVRDPAKGDRHGCEETAKALSCLASISAVGRCRSNGRPGVLRRERARVRRRQRRLTTFRRVAVAAAVSTTVRPPRPRRRRPSSIPNTIPKFQTQFQRLVTYVPTLTKDAHGNVIQKNFDVVDRPVHRAAAPGGFPGDDAVRLRRNDRRRVRAESQLSPNVARPEVRANEGRHGVDQLQQPADRRASHAGRSDARLGEPQQLPQAVAAVPAVPARLPPGAVADRARDPHPRHRGAAAIRRHAGPVVHRQRHSRPRVRVHDLHPAEQQPVGGVLVPRPLVRRHPPRRGDGAVRLFDPA